jgi:hypothetical protein
MFEPELFSITATQYRDFGFLILTSAAAFVFLYLLALPLKKIPFIDAPEDYKPPSWVLPGFALGSSFLLAGSLWLYFVLDYNTASMQPNDFLQSYYKERIIDLPSTFKVRKAVITILSYDGFSDFQILINGYRLFSSSHNCHLIYQCKTGTGAATLKKDFDAFAEKSVLSGGLSLHQLNEMNQLPHQEEFTDLLISSDNVVHINAENSGVQTCNVAFKVSLYNEGGTSINKNIIIIPYGTSFEQPTSPDDEVFISGAPYASNGLVSVYRTLPADQTLRLCERVRFRFALDGDQLPPDLIQCDKEVARCRASPKEDKSCLDIDESACREFRVWSLKSIYAPTVGQQ